MQDLIEMRSWAFDCRRERVTALLDEDLREIPPAPSGSRWLVDDRHATAPSISLVLTAIAITVPDRPCVKREDSEADTTVKRAVIQPRKRAPWWRRAIQFFGIGKE